MLKYESEIKVRAVDPSKFIKQFSEVVSGDFQYVFSNVYAGGEKIQIENSPLNFITVWNFYEIIKSAVVTISPTNKTVRIHYSIDFSTYLIFWFIISLLIVAIEFICGIEEIVVYFFPILWCGIAFLFTIISQIRFRGKVLDAVKMSGGKPVTY